MSVAIDLADDVVLVTGAAGTLGTAVLAAFADAGATVVGADVVEADDELPSDDFRRADFTDPEAIEETIEAIVADHGDIDYLANVAGTWQGGDPIEETDVETFEAMIDVNLRTMFLASKFALPHLQQSEGAIVSVSARSSLEGGSGDGPYRAAKAGVRLLTETIAAENLGTVRANAIMPSVIDTPMNREVMPDADHDAWVDPADIADVVVWLCSSGASVTSGAAVPVYGEA